MNVREYWTVLREDKWLVGSVLVVCVAIAAAVALFLPRTYTSTAIFYVASPQTTTSSSDSYQGAQLSTERVKSYSELLTGPRVAADASALLGGTPTPEQIQNSVSADSVAETVVLNLGVTRDTPQDAQLVGNAVATSFTRLVNSIESTGQPVNRPIVSTEVIFPPTLPSYPAGPGTTMLLAAGLLAGVVLGMGAALGRRALRRAVDTSDTLETALEAPVLAAMPGLPRRPDRPALLLEPAPGRRGRGAARARDRAAAVRRLRTAVLAGSDGRRCLVISGVRAEQGTTTVAVDLAVALALAGESVLLVDADLRRPALARRLGLAGDRGLATVLGGAAAEGAVQRWTTGGLDVLPAGPALENPGEAWGTPAASTALGALRGAYTWVLLDASPVTSSSESVDLARLADGVVLVARRGSARPEDLDAAAAGLRTVGAPVLGSVFTFAVDVPPAPVEAPRALPPGRSSVEPAEAPAAPVDDAPTADAPTADVPAAADTAPAEAPAAEPVAAETEPTTADAAETPSGPATAAAVATAAGVTGAAAAASARRSRPVRRNDPDLAQNAAQKSISDGEAQPEEPAKPKRRASSRKAGEPTPAAAAASDAVEPATLTATAEATEVPAKPATRIRKPRVAKTASTSVSPTTPTTSEAPTATPDEAVTPEPAASAGPTAPAATPDAASTPVEKPARKPRAARRTATTTPVEPTPVVEPAAATEPVAEAPAETTTAGATTTPVRGRHVERHDSERGDPPRHRGQRHDPERGGGQRLEQDPGQRLHAERHLRQRDDGRHDHERLDPARLRPAGAGREPRHGRRHRHRDPVVGDPVVGVHRREASRPPRDPHHHPGLGPRRRDDHRRRRGAGGEGPGAHGAGARHHPPDAHQRPRSGRRRGPVPPGADPCLVPHDEPDGQPDVGLLTRTPTDGPVASAGSVSIGHGSRRALGARATESARLGSDGAVGAGDPRRP